MSTDIQIPKWAAAKRPWDAAKKVRVVRSFQLLDPGVNFFVMTLEALGATPHYSCEGHPNGFYVLFEASYELARDINEPGFFSVVLETDRSISRPVDWWAIRLNRELTEASKRRTLRWAAEAWQAVFWASGRAEASKIVKTH